jgi:hypothetical protein
MPNASVRLLTLAAVAALVLADPVAAKGPPPGAPADGEAEKERTGPKGPPGRADGVRGNAARNAAGIGGQNRTSGHFPGPGPAY